MLLTCCKNFCRAMNACFDNRKVRVVLKAMLALSLMGAVGQALAAGGTDLLAGTEKDLLATIQGSGKKYIYMAEGIAALISYIATKNVFLFLGIVFVAIFINVWLSFVG